MTKREKDAAAVSLGRKGGKARMKKLGKHGQTKLGRLAAKARWAKHRARLTPPTTTTENAHER